MGINHLLADGDVGRFLTIVLETIGVGLIAARNMGIEQTGQAFDGDVLEICRVADGGDDEQDGWKKVSHGVFPYGEVAWRA